jgi:hypothetical protein
MRLKDGTMDDYEWRNQDDQRLKIQTAYFNKLSAYFSRYYQERILCP